MTTRLSLVEPVTAVEIIDPLVMQLYGPDVEAIHRDRLTKVIDYRLKPYGVELDVREITWLTNDAGFGSGCVRIEGVWAGARGLLALCEGGPFDRRGIEPHRDRRGIPALIWKSATPYGAPRVEYIRQGIRPEDGAWVYRYRPAVRP